MIKLENKAKKRLKLIFQSLQTFLQGVKSLKQKYGWHFIVQNAQVQTKEKVPPIVITGSVLSTVFPCYKKTT